MKFVWSRKLDGILLFSAANIFYTTGYCHSDPHDREVMVYITPRKVTLFSPPMFARQATAVTSNIEVIVPPSGKFWQQLGKTLTGKKVGIEDAETTLKEFSFLKKFTQRFSHISADLEKVRAVKDEDEVAAITKALRITEASIAAVVKRIKPGMAESDVAHRIEAEYEKRGADGVAFPTIVASGPNSGIPHHITSRRKIRDFEPILIDTGAKYKGYNGDITRTFFMGTPSKVFLSAYSQVEEARQAALTVITSGATTQEVDQKVRNVFEKFQVLQAFTHTSGHGLGIHVHEHPALAVTTQDTLKENMVITLEPGLYFDWGGVRVEDVIRVKNDGYEALSSFKHTWNTSTYPG